MIIYNLKTNMLMKNIQKIFPLLFVVSCTPSSPLMPPGIASSSSTPEAFQEAIEQGNGEVVARMLHTNPALLHADLQTRSRTGRAFKTKALHLAAKQGHGALIDLLLASGALVNELDGRGHTPLQYAAHKGHIAAIRKLVEQGADINIHRDHADKLAPLQEAYTVYKDKPAHWEVFTLLLDKGADPDIADKHRRTLLHWAAEDGQEAVVRRLVSKGANITCRDVNNETAAAIAARKGHGAIQQFLNDPIYQVVGMLHKAVTDPAALNEMGDLVDRLRRQPDGANSRIQMDNTEQTLLHLVIAFEGLGEDRKKDLARQLIDAGANPNAKDSPELSTPLHIAVKQGLINLVRYLVEDAAVFIDERDRAGFDPLYYARVHERREIQRILEAEQERRQDPGRANNKMIVLTNMLERDEYILLREMQQNNQIRIDEIIEKDGLSRPLLHWACCEGKPRLVAELLYGRAEQRIENPGALPDIERAAVSSELVVNIERPDLSGFSPLHHAARAGHLPIVKLLVEYMEIIEENSVAPEHSPKYTDHVANIVRYVNKATQPEFGCQTALQLAKVNKHAQVSTYLKGIRKGARYYCLSCVEHSPLAALSIAISGFGGGGQRNPEANVMPRERLFNKHRVWSEVRPVRSGS